MCLRLGLVTTMPRIHTVFFDALYTILRPRRKIAEVYADVITSHAEAVPLSAVEKSFPQGELPQHMSNAAHRLFDASIARG